LDNSQFKNNWATLELKSKSNPFWVELSALNAFSSQFEVKGYNDLGEILFTEEYEKGILKLSNCSDVPYSRIEFEFVLDNEIWGEDFKLNEDFLMSKVREFAYLHKKVKFNIKYSVEGESCNVVFHYKGGLRDKIQLEKLKGHGGDYFEMVIEEELNGLAVEIAFVFQNHIVDEPFLKSYANDYYTSENGTHVDGLLKGLTFGVMKYFQKYDLTEKYKISEKRMREDLIAIINVRLDAPIFSGCVRNKLANTEIIEPITNCVAELFFKRIESDKESIQKLIRKFEK